MKKILYITCLNKKNRKYDGERIKNTYIFDVLNKNYKTTTINLSVHKFINSFRIIWNGLFSKKKYDYLIISKDPHGANIIQRMLKMVGFPSSKIIYFEIGPFLYTRIQNKTINPRTFIDDKMIVVETKSLKDELESIGFTNIDVFPNFKPLPNNKFKKINYPKKQLELVFLSRIEEQKGLFDLIDALIIVNKDYIKYRLDIFGRIQSSNDRIKLYDYLNKYKFLSYGGKMDVGSEESYETLSNYDLHVFPTRYSEGFPGSLIDFFISGVPTLSSSFQRANEILSPDDSIVFEQFNTKDLIEKLVYIYNNQSLLNTLRSHSFDKRKEYSIQAFEEYLKRIL